MACRKWLARISLSATLAGCGGAAPQAAEVPGQQIATAPQPQILDRSLYQKDGSGALTEEQLQEILKKPIDLRLPARVGVVPLAEPYRPELPVSIGVRGTAAHNFALAVSESPQFSHVSDISTELPRPGGLEGLRVLAARYRLRYLLLYSERFEDDTHVNGWAALYPTIIGMFIAPGVTVQSHGIAQVDLLDVRTGTILFTVVEPMKVSSVQLMVGAARAHREKQAEAAALGATRLAKRVAKQTDLLVAFAERSEREQYAVRTRLLPPPILDELPVPAGGADERAVSP